MLHPRARKKVLLLEEQLKLLKQENKLLKELTVRQASVIEKLKLRIEELENIVFGKKREKKENDIDQDTGNSNKRDKKPRCPSTYRNQ